MKYRHGVLGMLSLLSMITYLDRICISVAGPRTQKDLHIGPEAWGWAISAFTLAYALFEIPSGMLGDRFGPRRMLTRIVLWWSAFTTLTGTARSLPMLMATRFAFGIGEAGAYPNSSVAISRWFPQTERARAHGVVWMASRVGGALAPLIIVPIEIHFGWRAVFWCFGALGLIWGIAWFVWFRDYPSEKPQVTKEELKEIRAGQSRHHALMPWRIAIRSTNLWTILLMYHTYCWGANFYMAWLHTYLQKGRGFTEREMGVLSVFPLVLGACANGLGGFLSDFIVRKYGLRWGRRCVGAVGLAFSGCFLLLVSMTENRLAAVVFLAFGYGSMDLMLATSWAICLDVGRAYAGALTGAMNMAGQLGSFLSAIVVGYLVQHFHSYNAPLRVLGPMALISAMIFLFIDASKVLIPEKVEPVAELVAD
jgi:MFS family permease